MSQVVGSGAAAPRLFPGLVAAMRPRQWLKNVLVLAAPAAAGSLADGDARARVLVAVVAFCLASAAGYLLNDVRDAEEDRLHPTKRRRPIAAGIVPSGLALAVAGGLLLPAFGLAVVLGARFTAILAGYVALTAVYSLWLRHVPVLDLAAVAGCHGLRALAGAAAVGVPVSRPFVVIVCAGALLVVAGRRLGDHLEPGVPRRAVTDAYSDRLLRAIVVAAACLTVATYAAWALVAPSAQAEVPAVLSALALAGFIARYVILIGAGGGGSPEDVLLRDPPLLALAVAWAACFAGAVYG